MCVPLQVNKPTLPLASGEYTPATGAAIVSVFAAMVTMLFQYGRNWTFIHVLFSLPFFWIEDRS
jgi:homogentisate phytyltransferase/homogentisate geranylgeranyltransferase